MKVLLFLFGLLAACIAAKPDYNNLIKAHYVRSLRNQLFSMIENVNQFEEKIKDEGIRVNINPYFDMALDTISNWLINNHMDPLAAPDIHKEFKKKVGVVTWHGQLNLTSGIASGISSLKRNADSILNYEHELLQMHIPITFKTLDINYHYFAQFMDLHEQGGVEGKIKELELHVDVLVDTKTTDIVLETFEVSHAGDIKLKFTGNNATDWIADIIADIVTGIFHDCIQKLLEKDVRKLVQEKIDEINSLPRMESF